MATTRRLKSSRQEPKKVPAEPKRIKNKKLAKKVEKFIEEGGDITKEPTATLYVIEGSHQNITTDTEQSNQCIDKQVLQDTTTSNGIVSAVRTIADLLDFRHPTIDTSKQEGKSPTTNAGYTQISTEHIRPLEGLNMRHIDAMYGEWLGVKIRLSSDEFFALQHASKEVIEVRGVEDDMYHGLKNWFRASVNTAFARISSTMQHYLGEPQTLPQVAHHVKLPFLKDQPGTNQHQKYVLTADWCINTDKFRDEIDVVGETKKSTAVNVSNAIIEELVTASRSRRGIHAKNHKNIVWCLRQVGTYALCAQTRYAFVQTPEAIMCLRFFMVKKGPLPSNTILGVEYVITPYLVHDALVPTLSRLVFTLTSMSQNANHREIVSEANMERLDLWYECVEDDQVYYLHHLSHAVRLEKPAPEVGTVINISHADESLRIQSATGLSRWTTHQTELHRSSSVIADVEDIAVYCRLRLHRCIDARVVKPRIEGAWVVWPITK